MKVPEDAVEVPADAAPASGTDGPESSPGHAANAPGGGAQSSGSLSATTSAAIEGPPSETAASGPADEPKEGFCLNHPNVPAVSVCTVCAEHFCSNCVDNAGLGATCVTCYLAGVHGKGTDKSGRVECKLAKEAFWMSIVGIFCFGIVIEPLALYRGIKAKKEIRESAVPMKGGGRATAAIVISSLALGLWMLNILRLIAVAARSR